VENSKLSVKIGNFEFNGEGPQEWLKEAYERFLLSLPAIKSGTTPAPDSSSVKCLADSGQAPDSSVLERAFLSKDEVVSLRSLPTTESANRTADAAILILYGFKRLVRTADVPVTRLNEGLRQSGINVKRVDKFINVHSQLYRKGGTRSGGRYSLTNAGELQAEKWLTAWYAE